LPAVIKLMVVACCRFAWISIAFESVYVYTFLSYHKVIAITLGGGKIDVSETRTLMCLVTVREIEHHTVLCLNKTLDLILIITLAYADQLHVVLSDRLLLWLDCRTGTLSCIMSGQTCNSWLFLTHPIFCYFGSG